MPTITTIPLLLLFGLLWRWTGGQILSIVAFVSIFSAASALNFGALGVSPWLFVLALGLLIKGITGHRPYQVATGTNRAAVCLMVLFLIYAVWSGFAYPVLFAGTPVVKTVGEEPLSWGMSNVAQLCYLVAVAVLYFMTLGCSREELRMALAWYCRGCTVAAAFAFYQLLNAVTHIPYPSAVLYSNKAHVVYPAYMINGVWRLNGTFCEASEMSGFLIVGIVLTGWSLVTKPFRAARLFALFLMVASLLMSVSSVGYICLAFVVLVGGILTLFHHARRGGLSIPRVVFGLILALGAATVFITVPSADTMVTKVVQSTLLDKQNSDSYRNRTLTHRDALATLGKTYYMGAGWGSARASGLVFVLLATIGLPGLLLFTAFVVSLAWPLFQRRHAPFGVRRTRTFVPVDQLAVSLFGVSALLLAMLIAGAEPVDPMLWILFGVATVGRSPRFRRVAELPAQLYESPDCIAA